MGQLSAAKKAVQSKSVSKMAFFSKTEGFRFQIKLSAPRECTPIPQMTSS